MSFVYIVIALAVVVLAGGLLFWYFYEEKKPVAKKITLAELKSIAKDRESEGKKLSFCVDKLLEFELDDSSKEEILEILYLIVKHKNSSKEIILKADKGLKDKNQNFKSDIDIAVKAGLDSRKR